jgi:hypothetical protein
MKTHTSKSRRTAVAKGFRSAFEMHTAEQLKAARIDFEYEPRDKIITYFKKVQAECLCCGCVDIIAYHKYLTDFWLNHDVILETKGVFDAENRSKILEVTKQNPELTVVMLFQAAHKKITKNVDYAKWCEKNGVIWLDSKTNWVEQLKEIIKKAKNK